jgi:hypothetical protein
MGIKPLGTNKKIDNFPMYDNVEEPVLKPCWFSTGYRVLERPFSGASFYTKTGVNHE